jgi:hypothetical protein
MGSGVNAAPGDRRDGRLASRGAADIQAPRRTCIELEPALMPADYANWYVSHLEKVSSAVSTIEHIAAKRLPPVGARLRRVASFGAEVRPASRGYEVSLNAALPALVHFAFNNLLRVSQFMSGIGDGESETPYRIFDGRIPLNLPRGLKIEAAIVAITGLSQPFDSSRAATAVLMSELAVAFCIYHELAHIFLGHADANKLLHGRTGLLEVTSRRSVAAAEIGKLRQVWEYEADLVAANMLLQDMASPQAEAGFRGAYGTDNDCDVVARFQAMLSAVLVVFLLIAQATSSSRRTHPDPLVRFAAIANDSAAALMEQQPQLQTTPEEMGEAVNDVASSVLSAWKVLGLKTSAASPIKNLLVARRTVEMLERHRQKLHARHSNLAHFYPFKT